MNDRYEQTYRLFKNVLQVLPCGDWESYEDGKITHFFGVTSCSLVDNYQCFEELTGSIYSV
jgi:hypothetical protein